MPGKLYSYANDQMNVYDPKEHAPVFYLNQFHVHARIIAWLVVIRNFQSSQM